MLEVSTDSAEIFCPRLGPAAAKLLGYEACLHVERQIISTTLDVEATSQVPATSRHNKRKCHPGGRRHWMWYRVHSALTTICRARAKFFVSMWLIDLAEQLPRAKLDGYDVSSSQFPPPEWLPRNVKLEVLDALAEVPSSLVEKYDVVHIGLLVLVVGDNPLRLLRNVIRMLST